MEQKTEEKVQLTNFKKPKRIVISKRDTIANDIKSGTAEGLLSVIFAAVSVILFLVGIYASYKQAGNGGYEIGIIMVMTFLFAAAGVLLSVLGFRNKEKTRHYMERRGLIISVIVLIVLTVVFIRGLTLFLAGSA